MSNLRFVMNWWHTLGEDGINMFGVGTMYKTFGGTKSMEIYKKRLLAGFEFIPV